MNQRLKLITTPVYLVLLVYMCLVHYFSCVQHFEYRFFALEKIEMLISISIPIHNKLRYLRACFWSIFASPFADYFEVIAIDANSNDGSAEFLDNLSVHHSQLKVFKRRVLTTSNAARIIGVENSVGEYIWQVDPDDQIATDIIGKLICVIKSGFTGHREEKLFMGGAKAESPHIRGTKFDMIEFSHIYVNVPLRKRLVKPMTDRVVFNKHEIMRDFVEKNCGWALWNSLIRRDIYLQAIERIKKIPQYETVGYATDLFHYAVIRYYAKSYNSFNSVGYLYFFMNQDSTTKKAQTVTYKNERKKSAKIIADLVHNLYDINSFKINKFFNASYI